VASLNKWFQGNFPMGALRILKQEHHLITDSNGNLVDELFVIQTGAYRDANDSNPATMNVARGRQSEYPKHMARFFAEDVATSSFGRTLALLKATEKTATKDDMQKVEAADKNVYEQKLEKRRYGSPGSRSAAVEDALRQSFEVENKQEDPQLWNIEKAVDSIGKFTPAEPPACCNAGHILKQGVAKTGKPYYGYVCKASNKDHARWAKMTAQGHFYFEGGE
jgi:hypothetical protein